MEEDKKIELTRLVEHLSHELRTPLSAILGYSELLEKSKNLDEAEKKHLEKITASGSRLLDVINDIIEISNMETGKVDLEESVILTKTLRDGVLSKFGTSARLKEIELQVSSESGMEEKFKGDEKRIKTIIYSLVNNAVKFTEKGQVEVTFSFLKTHGKRENIMLQVLVEDTGIGMDEEEVKHIFKPFWQGGNNQDGGTGLGLTTCQKLVQILGGSLEIDSKAGEGTQVKLNVPVKPVMLGKRKLPVEILKKSSVKAAKGLRALIVDDLPINRTLARIMLEMKDFETIEAVNGREALKYYRDQNPDVVLMDISMPEMDGIEAMEKIREMDGTEGRNIPIIAITAGGHTGSRNQLIDRGFSEYIQKPYKEKELFEKISLFLPITKSEVRKKTLKQAPLIS